MLVFLDTEFTRFANPSLISLALVAESGREFYAERSDFARGECSEFVVKTVLPLLGRAPDAVCDQAALAQRLQSWLDTLPGRFTLTCDFAGDLDLLDEALAPHTAGAGGHMLGGRLVLGRATVDDPVFKQALSRTYTEPLPRHHALADARALRAGYRAWRQSIETVWSLGSDHSYRVSSEILAHGGVSRAIKALPVHEGAFQALHLPAAATWNTTSGEAREACGLISPTFTA